MKKKAIPPLTMLPTLGSSFPERRRPLYFLDSESGDFCSVTEEAATVDMWKRDIAARVDSLVQTSSAKEAHPLPRLSSLVRADNAILSLTLTPARAFYLDEVTLLALAVAPTVEALVGETRAALARFSPLFRVALSHVREELCAVLSVLEGEARRQAETATSSTSRRIDPTARPLWLREGLVPVERLRLALSFRVEKPSLSRPEALHDLLRSHLDAETTSCVYATTLNRLLATHLNREGKERRGSKAKKRALGE